MLLLIALLGCGSDGTAGTRPVTGPLPTGPNDPRAYTESFLSRNPRALARLEHLIVVNLEPTAMEDGDTCNDRDGVDCIPYAVDAPTDVELSIADSAVSLEEVVLLDASRAVVLRQTVRAAPSAMVIDAGSYRLELHHRSPGDAAAPAQVIFLHPDIADDMPTPSSGGITGGDAPPATPRSAAPPRVHLIAQGDCVRCNFSGAFLDSEQFDGLDLTGSTFNRARMLNVSFRGAKMSDCRLLDVTSLYPASAPRGTSWEMASIDADFTGAVLSHAQFSLRAVHAPNFHFAGVFRGAKLDGTTWTGKRVSADDLNLLFNADFRDADLTNSRWEQEITVLKPAPQASIPRCTFQGADLTGTQFNDRMKANLGQCRFDKEPELERITVLHGIDLTGANVAGTTMADADLSGTTLVRTVMEGTDLSRANLSRAKISGVRWRGAILADAVIAGVAPATLNDMDLTNTDFTGIDFAGLDLSRTDFSKAVLDAAPRFAGATFSDGVHGINVSGHQFAKEFTVFKGAQLSGADLSHAELLEANLEGTTLNGAMLVGTNLNFANLRGAKLRGATLGVQPGTAGNAATLRGAFMPDVDLTDADLRSCDLTGAHLYGDQRQTLLVRTRLDSATFSNAICTGAHFSGSLNNAQFNGAQLVNTDFNNATLTGVKFDDAYLQGADFSNATTVTGAVLVNAAISDIPGYWSFKEADGTPFNFRYEATKLGALATDRSVSCPSGARGPCCQSGNLSSCLRDKLKPKNNGPFPPIPDCVPKPPHYDNCITPSPAVAAAPTPTVPHG